MTFWASLIKKLEGQLMSNFYCAKIIKEIIYENYLQLTPSYGVVILD